MMKDYPHYREHHGRVMAFLMAAPFWIPVLIVVIVNVIFHGSLYAGVWFFQ